MIAVIDLDRYRLCARWAWLILRLVYRSRVCMFVAHKALHLHIGSIIENVAIEETPEAAQEPEGEPQF